MNLTNNVAEKGKTHKNTFYMVQFIESSQTGKTKT